MGDKLNANGISPEKGKIDKLLEKIVEKEMTLELEKENIDDENNKRMEAENVAADEMRRNAIETQAQIQKR